MVLLVYPPGLDFIIAFLACLTAGVVAVPVYPPDPRKLKKDLTMFVAIAHNCGATVALTSANYAHAKKITQLQEKLTRHQGLKWPDTLQWSVSDTLLSRMSIKQKMQLWRNREVEGPTTSDIAFLQYTSGSTSMPKGVMLTHANLNHNLKIISSALCAGKDTVVVSWLPQYHDMGLIGAYLGTLFNGGSGVYMSPFTFIKNPMIWLQLISQYKATHLQAPNFAYSLCARKSDTIASLKYKEINLSSVRHMINGAEPVKGDSINAFYRAFEPYGLATNVIKATYGLAEHTVYVCGGDSTRLVVDKQLLETQKQIQPIDNNTADGNTSVKEMISCGKPNRKDYGVEVCIVDPDTCHKLQPGNVGEIWISSPSKALGYFDESNTTMSEEAFQARITTDTEVETSSLYLRTGDLGFLHDEELYICGRLKDLIIVRGRNHYPQDLEFTVESFPEIRPGCTAAFSSLITKNATNQSVEEELIIVAELRDPKMQHKASLCSKIRSAIVQEHGVKATVMILLPPHSIPKTTSGKISRSRCQQSYEQNTLPELYRNEDILLSENLEDDFDSDTTVKAPQQAEEADKDILEFLVSEVAQVLEVEKRQIVLNVPLQNLGLDSMALAQLQGIIAQRFQIQIQDEILYAEETTLETLQAVLQGKEVVCGDQNAVEEPKRSKRILCGCISC